MEAVELIKSSVDALSDKVSEQAEKLATLGDSVSNKVKQDFDTTFAELNSKIAEIKQAQATQVAVETNDKSVGDAFIRNFKDNQGRLEINTIKSSDVGGSTYHWTTEPQTQARWSLFDLIPVSYIGQTSINYTKQVAFDNKARPVDESTEKPHSHLTFQKAEAVLRTVAHYEMVTRQALVTDSELRNIINNELYQGLVLSTENQIINGTGQQVTDADGNQYTEWNGLLSQATELDAALLPDDANAIDTLRFAMAQTIKGRGWADGIILNPIDWAKIETAKVNNNGTGAYIVGNPVSGSGRRTLWGLPVVDTWAIDAGSFVVGAFQTACRVFLQNQGVVYIEGYINDQLIKNEMTIVAELMGNVGVKKPLQIIKGNFE